MPAPTPGTTELATSRNKAGVTKAEQLIAEGKIKESASWEGPSTAAMNKFIKAEGWARFGEFHLGRDKGFDAETKAHWKYPFSSDFANVSINGLRAIRTRSAQTEEAEIFASAGRLLDEAKTIYVKASRPAATRLPRAPRVPSGRGWGAEAIGTFSAFSLGAEAVGHVDREAGTIEGISILSVGEARGHGMMISEKTLEAAIALLIGKSLPAYLSHAGSNGDRLLTEAGFFSGFYRDRDQIRARQFTALDTFKKYDREKYDRLFEIAEKAPATFGVSIVFEGQLFWELRDGSEVSIEVGLDAPENARFEMPTVRPLTITSADFVDTPAANGALFRKVDTQPISEDMNSDIEILEKPTVAALGEPPNESASAHHETDEDAAPAPPKPEPATEPSPKPTAKRKKKKALAQDDEDREDEERGEEDEIAKEDEGEEPDTEREKVDDELEEPDDEYEEKMRAAVEETYTHLENAVRRLREIMDMTGVPDSRKNEAEGGAEGGEMEKLKARVDELTKLHAGTAPIKEPTETKAFETPTAAKKHLISLHLEAHPKDSRSTAVLAIAKTNPELFKNN